MTTHLAGAEFQNALTPSLLRQMQIIQVAISAAPLLYLAVVLILEFNNLFTEERLRRSIPEGPVSTDLLVNLSLMLLRTGMILRLAFFEAIAFIGLSVCVIAVSTGVVDGHPEFWLNCTTTLILAVFSVMTFPTKERVVQLFNEKLASNIASWASTVPLHT
jgi:hypothetical protein